MRRLTLILSDLYLPAEAGRAELAGAVSLPSLDWLLRFAGPAQSIDDWRRWLALDLEAGGVAQLPAAQLTALHAGVAAPRSWFATPVQLEARLDHVRLANRGILHLTAEQSATLRAEFARTFGPELRLLAANGCLLLQGGPDAAIDTVDPARLLDADIGAALPSGPAAGELRRLGAELEMWLPGTACNEARKRAGQRAIAALWLWGGGASVTGQPSRNIGPVRLYGGDAWLAALAELVSPGPARPAPANFASLAEDELAGVELTPLSGPLATGLAALEQDWFAPARAALAGGALAQLTLVANDRVFHIGARAGWKFWRRRVQWGERLRHDARTTEA
jgi:hypothetical protein